MTHSILLATSIIPPGLIIVATQSKSVLEDARLAVLDQVLNGGNSIGLQFGKFEKVISLNCGLPHQKQHIEARHACLTSPKDVEHHVEMMGSRGNFDFCSDEAAVTINPMIRVEGKAKRRTALIFGQSLDDTGELLVAHTLGQLRREAIDAGMTIIAILARKEGFDTSDLPHLCEEFIEVDEVEPDFDVDFAMSFDCHSLRGMSRFGVGKTMCSIRYADNRITHFYTPFISGDAIARTIWRMRCAGQSYAEIGEFFGTHKSTILRRLKELPSTAGHKVDKKWLTESLENLDLDEDDNDDDELTKKSKHAVDDDDDDIDDDDDM